jgi:hypothetical protein
MTAVRRAKKKSSPANGMSPSRLRVGNAGQRICSCHFVLGSAILGGQFDPYGASIQWRGGFLLAALGFVAVCLWIVFPQDSPDKLAWWREWWTGRRKGPIP